MDEKRGKETWRNEKNKEREEAVGGEEITGREEGREMELKGNI